VISLVISTDIFGELKHYGNAEEKKKTSNNASLREQVEGWKSEMPSSMDGEKLFELLKV